MGPPEEAAGVDEADRWLADQRVDAAVAERRREHWLGRQAGESATLTGILRALAERGSPVVVDAPGGRRHRGRLLAVAEDFVALERADDELSLLRTATMGAVHELDAGAPVLGDRAPAVARDFATAVATLAADRPRVVAVTADGTVTTGELLEVGRDVAVLRVGTEPPATAYLPLAFLAEVAVAGSG